MVRERARGSARGGIRVVTMAVIEINDLARGTWGPRWGPEGRRTYRITKEVITDGDDPGPDVMGDSRLPQQFQTTHPNDPKAFCVGADPEQDEDDATYWRIAYDYSTNVPEFAQAAVSPSGGVSGGGTSDPSYDVDNPLNRPPKIRLRNKRFKRTRFVDLDGDPIENAAGVPFEAYQEEVSRLVIDITRNLPDFDYELLNRCEDGVNEAAFIGFPARKVWCMECTADPEYDKETFFWIVHAIFVVGNDDDILTTDPDRGGGPDAWWFEWRLNAGYDKLVNGALVPIRPHGQRPARPVLLDLFGDELQSSQDPIYLGFRVKRDAPLHALGLFD